MCLLRAAVTLIALLFSNLSGQEADYAKAIATGMSFKSRLKYLEAGTKDQRIQLASAWAKDGMSKYVTLFTDFEAIASAAAQANQEMRPFSVEDAKKMPLTGLVFAHVEVHARGSIPVKKLAKRYVQNAAHLVLEVDGKVIQPVKKELTRAVDASVQLPVGFYTFWQSTNVSLLTGGTLGIDGAKAEMEFAYSIDPAMRSKKGKVILIDADGNKHFEDVDFSKVLR